MFYQHEPRTCSITKFTYDIEEDYKSFIIYG